MRKIIDENGRLFGKIRVLDVLVILVVLVLAAAAYRKLNVIEDTTTSVKTIPTTYTVIVKNVRQTTADMYRAGDRLYNEAGIPLGVVAAVSTAPGTTVSITNDGTYVVAPVEGRVDMTVTVSANCSTSNGRYYVERTFELNAGADCNLRSKYASVYGTLLSIAADGGAA
jgi:hypothetical protein